MAEPSTGAPDVTTASGEALTALVPVIIGGLLIVYSVWWVYFDRPVHDLLTSLHKAVILIRIAPAHACLREPLPAFSARCDKVELVACNT